MRPQTAFDRHPQLEIVDVRGPGEWEAGHIEGARHIPLDELGDRIAELQPGLPVVAVCRTGGRSGRSVELLRSLGIEADHVEGGLMAWSKLGLPLTAAGGRPGTVATQEAEHDDHDHDDQEHDDHEHLHGHGRDDHDHEHRHGHGRGHGGEELGPAVLDRVIQLMTAIQDHFGDREPSEEEARAFFQQLLAAEGKTSAEIDEMLS